MDSRIDNKAELVQIYRFPLYVNGKNESLLISFGCIEPTHIFYMLISFNFRFTFHVCSSCCRGNHSSMFTLFTDISTTVSGDLFVKTWKKLRNKICVRNTMAPTGPSGAQGQCHNVVNVNAICKCLTKGIFLIHMGASPYMYQMLQPTLKFGESRTDRHTSKQTNRQTDMPSPNYSIWGGGH